MSLYALRKSPLGFSITKFDTDFNPEATYDLTVGLHNNYGCSCPAAKRSVCRHRIMLPRMLGHVGDGWFYNYETQKWHRPLVEEAQLATEPSANAEGASSPSEPVLHPRAQAQSLAGAIESGAVRLVSDSSPVTGNIRRRV